MTIDDPAVPDITIFSARLTPHRSLSERGFCTLMLLVAAISFVAGMMFLLIGAWPVCGFFGLDVALVYWALRANFRSAVGQSEEIIVTPSALTVRRSGPRGGVEEWRLNPLWTRMESEADPEFGVTRLALVSRGQSVPIATCVGPREKQRLAAALLGAISEAKRGPTRTVLAEVS